MSTQEPQEQPAPAAAGEPPAVEDSAPLAGGIVAAAQALYPDAPEPFVRLAALMAALDAEGQELILAVLEAYSAWDHYLARRKRQISGAPPVAIPGMQAAPETDETPPLEALSVAITELATRVAVLEQVVHGPRPPSS